MIRFVYFGKEIENGCARWCWGKKEFDCEIIDIFKFEEIFDVRVIVCVWLAMIVLAWASMYW